MIRIYDAICFFMEIFGIFFLWIISGACSLSLFFVRGRALRAIYRLVVVLSIITVFFTIQCAWLFGGLMGPSVEELHGKEAVLHKIESASESLVNVVVIIFVATVVYVLKRGKEKGAPISPASGVSPDFR
jgi:hypothetical protein